MGYHDVFEPLKTRRNLGSHGGPVECRAGQRFRGSGHADPGAAGADHPASAAAAGGTSPGNRAAQGNSHHGRQPGQTGAIDGRHGHGCQERQGVRRIRLW